MKKHSIYWWKRQDLKIQEAGTRGRIWQNAARIRLRSSPLCPKSTAAPTQGTGDQAQQQHVLRPSAELSSSTEAHPLETQYMSSNFKIPLEEGRVWSRKAKVLTMLAPGKWALSLVPPFKGTRNTQMVSEEHDTEDVRTWHYIMRDVGGRLGKIDLGEE